MQTKTKERRVHPRVKGPSLISVTFELQGKEYSAEISNISRSGMHLLLSKNSAVPDLQAGKEIVYTLYTEVGPGMCPALTRWTKKTKKQLVWGASFVADSRFQHDPFMGILSCLPETMQGAAEQV